MGSRELVINQPAGPRQDGWAIVTRLVLNGISSCHTRRAYAQALEEFLIWFQDEPGRAFNKAAIQEYRTELQIKGLAPSSINVRLSAIRRLAREAADNGLIVPELAAGIGRAKGVKQCGVRLGHWLTAEQAEQLLALPDVTSLKGNRDLALLALLLGSGLRRAELVALNVEHIQSRDGRWLIADLTGKNGRMRTVPIPGWASAAIHRWLAAAGIAEGPIFRSITRSGEISDCAMSPQAVLSIVAIYRDTFAFGNSSS